MTSRATAKDMRRAQRVAMGLMVLAALLTFMVVRAAVAHPTVNLVGTLVGPCMLATTGTVEIRAGGELVDSGAVGWWDPGERGLCSAPVTVHDIPPHDEYTVTMGALSGSVRQSEMREGTVVRLWAS